MDFNNEHFSLHFVCKGTFLLVFSFSFFLAILPQERGDSGSLPFPPPNPLRLMRLGNAGQNGVDMARDLGSALNGTCSVSRTSVREFGRCSRCGFSTLGLQV